MCAALRKVYAVLARAAAPSQKISIIFRCSMQHSSANPDFFQDQGPLSVSLRHPSAMQQGTAQLFGMSRLHAVG